MSMENVEVRTLQEQAKQAIRERRLTDAQQILKQAASIEKNDVTTWLLYTYALTDNPQKQQEAMRYAKQIAPFDPRVLKREIDLAAQSTAAVPVSAPIISQPPANVNSVQKNASKSHGSLTLLLSLGSGVVIVVIIVGAIALLGSRTTVSLPTAQSLSVSGATPSDTPAISPSTTVVANTISVAANVTASDPLAETATALVNQQTATSQAMGDALKSQTQVALLTQTATLQGALAVTVSAKQTSIAVMDSLPGHLVFPAGNAGIPVNPKVLSVSQANAITPDNQHIAYRTNQFDGDLVLANLDGSAQQKVLSGKHQGQISWAPDTKHFAVVEQSTYPDTVTLAVGSLDGTEPKMVTATGMQVQAVAWSPDAHQIVFVGKTSPGSMSARPLKIGVYSVGVGGASTVQAIVPPLDEEIADLQWVADGQKLLYCVGLPGKDGLIDQYAIQTVNGDGTHQQTVAALPSQFSKGCQSVVSPNGKWVSLFDNTRSLYLLSTDTGTLKNLLTLGYNSTSNVPQWSPDGNYLAGYTSANSDHAQVYWVDAEKGTVSFAKLAPDYTYLTTLWSPDSKSILTCHSENQSGAQTGQVVLVPVNENSTPVVLFDQPICPTRWLP